MNGWMNGWMDGEMKEELRTTPHQPGSHSSHHDSLRKVHGVRYGNHHES